ncbi:MAG: acpS [Frankiales bacterium]|nr:acpS [Frankiales bacterium]
MGIDVVPIERFASASERTARLTQRLFTPQEQRLPSGEPRSAESLAARFAAKEALAKALGAPGGMRWHDAEVVSDEHGAPSFLLAGTVAARAAELGVARVHLSLSHDGGIASAVVIAEGA